MQLFQQPFDANTVKPNEAFEPVPAGWYVARIINSEAKPTKDNESGYLLLDLEIIDGEHKGRKVFDRLNLWNKSAQASEIAQRQLSAYCHATGVLILQDSAQLHGIPIKIKLTVRTQEGYDPSNDVKAVKNVQDVTPAAQPTPPFAAVAVVNSAPFGQNPALPSQPATPPVQQPTQQPAPPWAPPAATVATAMPAWAPPAATAQQQPTPAAGPTPPWRKP